MLYNCPKTSFACTFTTHKSLYLLIWCTLYASDAEFKYTDVKQIYPLCHHQNKQLI